MNIVFKTATFHLSQLALLFPTRLFRLAVLTGAIAGVSTAIYAQESVLSPTEPRPRDQ
jgi:hypothetical protein